MYEYYSFRMRLDTDEMFNVKPCPLCGNKSVSAVHAQKRLIGYTEGGIKILSMKCYCTCNHCHAKSRPVSYIGYCDASIGFYDDDHPRIYDLKYKVKALDEWNRRKLPDWSDE